MKSIKYIGENILADTILDLLSIIFILLDYSDPLLSIVLSITKEKITCHITPSNKEFKQDIIDNLLYLVKILKIKLIFSKSLGISHIISFDILI